ncbi:hypothetical protein BJ912DRAFT_799267, partial [Pholiota molesta]
GPDGNDLLIDFKDKINSKWNKRAINLLADYVCKKLRRLELPKRSEGYVTDVIQEYVKRAAGYWRQAQPKLMESGKHESPEHLEKRLISRRAKLGQKARANTRRSEVLMEAKKRYKDLDRHTWVWLDELLHHLGEEGMSSDESEVDDHGNVYFSVKKLPWRAPVEEYLKMIDDQRKKDKNL